MEVSGQSEPYVLLNITRVVKCIDDEASDEVHYVTPEHGLPDQLGEYRSVIGMRIDPAKVGDAQVFRTWGWVAIVVSEAIKEALEELGATGPKFKEVTGPSTISADERTRNRNLGPASRRTARAWRFGAGRYQRSNPRALAPHVMKRLGCHSSLETRAVPL